MRRKLIILSIIIGFMSAKAQQRPHYTQYLQNMQVINPAVTGMYKALELRAGTRNQWLTLESAPKTSYFTVSTPINFDSNMLTAGSADFGIEDPATRSDRSAYMSSENHHGVGMVILNDKQGAYNRANINLTYAYHLAVGDVANLSFGISGGIARTSINANELKFEDPYEPALAEGAVLNWTPDLNAGVYFYMHQFYFGASLQQILKQKLSFNENYEIGKEVGHYFFTTGFRFWVAEDVSLTPSVMLKFIKPLPTGLDANLKVSFRNNFWLAGSYRKKDSFSTIVGFTVSKVLDAGYAYDITRSPLQTVSSGTHEFVLGLKF